MYFLYLYCICIVLYLYCICTVFVLYLYCICIVFVGMISLELPLSEEPVLGKWKIFADIEKEKKTQEFEVKEYGVYIFSLRFVIE